MNAYVPGSIENPENTPPILMPITDCSRLAFDVTILDESIFKFVGIQSPSQTKRSHHSNENACAVIVVDSLRTGRTSIKLTYAPSETQHQQLLQSNEMQIGSYSSLKSYKSLITLAKDASLMVNLYDGPLFSSIPAQPNGDASFISGSYQSETLVSDREVLEVTGLESENQANRYSYRVKCVKKLNDQSDANYLTVKFSLAHKKSHVNKCPLVFDYKLKVCAFNNIYFF